MEDRCDRKLPTLNGLPPQQVLSSPIELFRAPSKGRPFKRATACPRFDQCLAALVAYEPVTDRSRDLAPNSAIIGGDVGQGVDNALKLFGIAVEMVSRPMRPITAFCLTL
jgi:hypothetical protein